MTIPDLQGAIERLKADVRDTCEPGRESAIVLTKLDEASLWLLRSSPRQPPARPADPAT